MKKINTAKLSPVRNHLLLLSTKNLTYTAITIFSIIICSIIFNSYKQESFINWQDSIKVNGFVISINETHFGMGGDISSIPIFEYGYSYLFEDSMHSGKSYSTGKRLNKNDEIIVLVKENNFDKSKISEGGFRSSPFPIWGLGLIILPFTCLYFCYKSVKESLSTFSSIRNGILTEGTYFYSEETKEEEDEMKFYKHNIKYIVENEEVIAQYISSDKVLNDKLNIVYNHEQKEEFIILDYLPVLFRKKMIKKLKNSI